MKNFGLFVARMAGFLIVSWLIGWFMFTVFGGIESFFMLSGYTGLGIGTGWAGFLLWAYCEYRLFMATFINVSWSTDIRDYE